jgi:hypothetical protein
MDLLFETLLKSIREQCSANWNLDVFRDHIIVNLPAAEEDFRTAFHKVKREITTCVGEHFPDRESDTLFEVRNGSWNCSFKIGKTAVNGL